MHIIDVLILSYYFLFLYRRYDNGQSPNVKKAKDLVEDLSNIKDQVKNLVEVFFSLLLD